MFRIGLYLGILAGLVPTAMGFYMLWQTKAANFGGGNLVGNGVCLICLVWFGVARGLRWSWFLFAFLVLFVGFNDLVVILKSNMKPVTIIPLSAGILSLFMTRREVFSRSAAPPVLD